MDLDRDQLLDAAAAIEDGMRRLAWDRLSKSTRPAAAGLRASWADATVVDENGILGLFIGGTAVLRVDAGQLEARLIARGLAGLE